MKQTAASPILPAGLEPVHRLDAGQANTKFLALDGIIVQAADAGSAEYKKSSFTDVVLRQCLLFGANFDGSGWQRLRAEGGSWSGVVLSDTALKDVHFEGVKLNLANFRMAKLERVVFEGCDLSEADFGSAQLKDLWFKNCNLAKADFNGTKLKAVDLRSSQLTDLRGVTSLKNATVSLPQLMNLSQIMAAEIGIVVDD